MDENINTASQKSPASQEVSDEVAETVEGSSATDSETITAKRKRDRPRKDEAHDHADMKSSRVPLPPDVSNNSSMKRSRGRPKGSGKLQVLATIGGYFAATAGGNFHPYAMTIKPGEDMVRTIMSFAKMAKQAVCILAATGVVSKVIVHNPGSSNPLTVHEGSYHIIILSGSYRYHKVGKKLYMMGELSISLAAPDGQVFGGSVGGSIIAEEPIQLIIGTFKENVISDFLKRKHSSSASPQSVVENALPLRVWQPIDWGCNQKASSDTVAVENENCSPASP